MNTKEILKNDILVSFILCPPVGILALVYCIKAKKAIKLRDNEKLNKYLKIIKILMNISFVIALSFPTFLIIKLLIA